MKNINFYLKKKKVLISLFLTFTILSCAGPQKTAEINDAEAPLKSSIIEVKVDMKPKQAYKKTAQVLQDKGFALSSTDETLLSITTKGKEYAEFFGPISPLIISADVRENPTKIVIRGTYSEDNFKIKKTGQEGSPVRKAWIKMHNIATQLGNNLSYRR